MSTHSEFSEKLFPEEEILEENKNHFITTLGSARENSCKIPVFQIESLRQTSLRRKLRWKMRKLMKKKNFEKKEKKLKNGKVPFILNKDFLKLLKREKMKKKVKKIEVRWGISVKSLKEKDKFYSEKSKNDQERLKEIYQKKISKETEEFFEPSIRDIAILEKKKILKQKIKKNLTTNSTKPLEILRKEEVQNPEKLKNSSKTLKSNSKILDNLTDKKTSLTLKKLNKQRTSLENEKNKVIIKAKKYFNFKEKNKKILDNDFLTPITKRAKPFKIKLNESMRKTESLGTLNNSKNQLNKKFFINSNVIRPKILDFDDKIKKFFLQENYGGESENLLRDEYCWETFEVEDEEEDKV